MTGVLPKIACEHCDGCTALPMASEEYRLHYATAKVSAHADQVRKSKALVELKAFTVFCHKKQQRMIFFIE